jgi:hypothetical protein
VVSCEGIGRSAAAWSRRRAGTERLLDGCLQFGPAISLQQPHQTCGEGAEIVAALVRRDDGGVEWSFSRKRQIGLGL